MKPTLNFEYLTPLKVEETSKGKAVISGTLATTGISRNGHAYDLPTLRQVAESSVGKPLYYGTTTKIDPNTGIRCHNMHDDVEANRIGKITRTTFNKRTGIVKFLAEVWNTSKFPKLVSQVKRGFGISLKGIAYDAKNVLDRMKGIVTKIGNIIIESVQLMSPETKRGIQNAQVEAVQVQESMTFFSYHNRKFLTAQEITLIVQALSNSGEL